MDVAYVAGGELHLSCNGKSREIESPFAEGVRARAASIAKRNAWKSQGPGARFVAGFGGVPDGDELLNQGAAPVPVAITGIARGRAPKELLYTQRTDVVSGLFKLPIDTLSEQRLYHHNGPILADPCVHPNEDMIAVSIRGAAWASHLAVAALDGRNLREITEGDVVDRAPSWVPGERRSLVYQSSGIGRDRYGLMSQLGCAGIYRLDIDRGEVSSLLEDPAADFVAPRMSEDGTLYAVRRPRTEQDRVAPMQVLTDIALLPFRVARAMFNYLEFFSMRYSGKPLLTATGMRAQRADLRRMLLAANMIDATRGGESESSLLTELARDWTLVKLAPQKSEPETVVAGVSCFDIAPGGDLLYADGSAIHRLSASGGVERVCDARGVVAFVGL